MSLNSFKIIHVDIFQEHILFVEMRYNLVKYLTTYKNTIIDWPDHLELQFLEFYI